MPSRTRLEFLLQDVGPGTERLCELGAGDRAAAGRAARASASRRRARGARALLVGGGVGIAPLAILAGRADGGRHRAGRRCSASATPHHATGAALLAGAAGRDRRRQRRTSRPRSPTCSPTSSICSRTLRCTRAGRRRCSRRSGAVRRARGAGPARARVRDGVRLRRLLRVRRAHARGLRAAVRRRTGDRRRPARERARPGAIARMTRQLLRDRARAPDHQRLGHVRRDRGAARVRRGAARALPVRRVRLQDRHGRPAAGQPAAAALGARRRA